MSGRRTRYPLLDSAASNRYGCARCFLHCPMRAFAIAVSISALVSVLAACFPLDTVSGFGNRTLASACRGEQAPWLIPVGIAPALKSSGSPLRAVTYNVHSGLGARLAFRGSRRVVESNLRAIAQTIAAAAPGDAAPDVIALNEVDFSARRSGGFDQARFIADELLRLTSYEYRVVSGETWRRNFPGFEVSFGNAVLVRHPVISAGACLFDDAGTCRPIHAGDDLPPLRALGLRNRIARENRGVIKLTMDFHGRPVDVIATHLDAFVLAEREAQAAHLLRRFVDPAHTTLVLGDFNTVPTALAHGRTYFIADRTHDILTSGSVADARILHASIHGRADLDEWATYPAAAPKWPLDGILGSLDLIPERVTAIGEMQSDHRGLAVRYSLRTDPAVVAIQRARHDAIRRRQFAQILRCDLGGSGPEHAARIRWLLHGTGFLEIASLAERQRLMAALPPL